MAKNSAKEQRRKDKERKEKRPESQKQSAQASTVSTADMARAAATASPAKQPHPENMSPMSSSPSSATPEQQRAAFALERIQELRQRWSDRIADQKEFNSHASAMPFMIRANGLGQTAAFYRSKTDRPAYQQLYQLLGDWLTTDERPFTRIGQTDLITAITQSDQDAYLAAQIEALLFLDWLKKLASAFLAREDDAIAPLPSGERGWGEGRSAS